MMIIIYKSPVSAQSSELPGRFGHGCLVRLTILDLGGMNSAANHRGIELANMIKDVDFHHQKLSNTSFVSGIYVEFLG